MTPSIIPAVLLATIFVFPQTQAKEFQDLLATRNSLEVQNAIIDKFRISRVLASSRRAEMKILRGLIKRGELVGLPQEGECFKLSGKHVLHPYLRPEVKKFLEDLARDYCQKFGKERGTKLKVTEAARTGFDQKKLFLEGESIAFCRPGGSKKKCSTHLAGVSFDVSILEMAPEEKMWLADQLRFWRNRGRIIPVFEPNLNHFHITVIEGSDISPASFKKKPRR